MRSCAKACSARSGLWTVPTVPAGRWRNSCWPPGAHGRRAGQPVGPARLFDSGHNRKIDAHDTHAVAVVGVRSEDLRVLSELIPGKAKKDT